MAAPRKYPDELRERATRLAVDAGNDPATRPGALARIGGQTGDRSGDAAELGDPGRDRRRQPAGHHDQRRGAAQQLEREVKELRRANAILRSASAFFAGELDRPSR